MATLSQQQCVPCQGNVPPVTEEEIAQYKPQIPDWSLKNENGTSYLERSYTLANFKRALALAQQVGDIAEQEQHHPTLIVEWGKLTVQWWTHTINGLHQNDFIMAAKTDEVVEQVNS
ncbi:MAG: 4a-hydroxytetrahydrobiopterin dehydratase [Cyanobacteria bacterium]|jgi:4a-hydroxytetrahydrobiopterin dehydratase|nr:4a-hydroxytetrahydrobiopterin dehydratase [Cyanobacteria bacterium GSL.Bin1]